MTMTTNIKQPETVVSTETSTLVKNIRLDGFKTLLADEVTTTYEVTKIKSGKRVLSRNKLQETSIQLSFEIKEVTAENLEVIRKAKISSFVFKDNDKLYYANIPDNISFVGSSGLGNHLCGAPCKQLSPASDREGGCAKVRARSTRIERYPWIKKGYETFNTRHDCFVVIECDHYKTTPPQKRLPLAKVNELKLGLAQFVWDDVETLPEARKRAIENRAAENQRKNIKH